MQRGQAAWRSAKHALTRGNGIYMWHIDALQLQLECSFLGEICRKGQKGLLTLSHNQSTNQIPLTGWRLHQGPWKFGRVLMHMHTNNFCLNFCQHIPSTEHRPGLYHLTGKHHKLWRLQYQEAQQFLRGILHSEGDCCEEVFEPQSTLNVCAELLWGPYWLKSFVKQFLSA